MRLALIGYGNIATSLLGILAEQGLVLDRLDILARPGAEDRAKESCPHRHQHWAAAWKFTARSRR